MNGKFSPAAKASAKAEDAAALDICLKVAAIWK
ncbi:hypothetical protein CGSMWGv1500E_05007 [Gardnerella vaginalis 1500E]|uniref:Uncharacterized protein n=1 Tax=Gardnerella vaginalis 1500E TaxID=698957 RepID=I4LZ13_GARVA|nr:hypothetical protein CGSMWGv1500E_05007 [Gardnerella vaginalis 1500E]